jgi:lipopolysaccharide export system protein LptC
MNASKSEHTARIERLSRREGGVRLGRGYSRFVRIMRLVLPMAAMAVVAILFLMPGMNENKAITAVTKESEALPKHIVKNELLKPKFESRDKKNQPYEIVAARAVQGAQNKDLIMLEEPVGTITLSDGVKVTIHSKTGAYRQDTERFFLEGNVQLEHGEGYLLESDEAHMDLRGNYVWSEKDVHGKGPDVQIDAKGLKANGKTGQVVFTGPAKLVLDGGMEGFK